MIRRRGGGQPSLVDDFDDSPSSVRSASAGTSGFAAAAFFAALFASIAILAIGIPSAVFSSAGAQDAAAIRANTSVVTAAVTAPCSKYRAFGTRGEVQGFLPTVNEAQSSFLDHQVNTLNIAGGFVAGGAGHELHSYYAGFANIATGLSFASDTIIRLFSQTKFIGIVGFFKFMSEHNVNGDDLLRDFLPSYATPQVIVPLNPDTPYLTNNAFTTTAGSRLVTVTTTGLVNGIANGDNITISGVLGAVDGIPASELNGIHTVSVSAPGSFRFYTSTPATTGLVGVGGDVVVHIPTVVYANIITTTAASNVVIITTPQAHGWESGETVAIARLDDPLPVDGIPSEGDLNGVHVITVTGPNSFTFNAASTAIAGVALTGGNVRLAWFGRPVIVIQQTQPDFFCTFNFDYYTTTPANPPIAIRHIMEHSVGWTYGTHADLGCTPFNAPGATPYIRHANIQSQIARTLNLAIFGDLPGRATSGQGVVAWANSWAQVPLMFNPGEYFSYSPVISLLGAVMEVADASPIFSYDNPPKARNVTAYMKERLFDPLGMIDTTFFIQDWDTRRTDMLARLSEVYFTHTGVPVTFVLPFLAPVVDWQYEVGRPRGTAMFDTGLLSTPADQLRFFQMIKQGGKLVNGTQWIPTTLLAEASRTQNSHFQGGVGGYANGVLQRGRQATWGYGAAVASFAHPFQTTSTPMGSRTIGWLGVLNTAWFVDFGQDTMALTGIQGLGGWVELFRATTRYNEYLRCIDPIDTDLPSTQL